jgi:DNA-binding CsgD family transcriptional regulator
VVKTREADLRNFCILYALFTLVLILSVLRNYLSLNVEGYSPQAWYVLSGISIAVESAVIVALIHFLVGIYRLPGRRVVTSIFLITMLACMGLLFSPLGAALDAGTGSIHLGIGFRASSVWYFASFTVAFAVGFGFLRQVWNTDRKNFMLGLLIFASVGYIETLLNFPGTLRMSTVHFGQERDFLYSSIPYALYGLFLINYFLRFSLPAPLGVDQLSDEFLSKYGITGREREIILMVVQGKSNADIAGELFISLATVKTHLHNVYQKMGVDSRYDLLARVRSGQ